MQLVRNLFNAFLYKNAIFKESTPNPWRVFLK